MLAPNRRTLCRLRDADAECNAVMRPAAAANRDVMD